MNKNILIPPLIIAVSIIVATIAYLYFNPQARCERNNVKTITYNLLKDNTDLKNV